MPLIAQSTPIHGLTYRSTNNPHPPQPHITKDRMMARVKRDTTATLKLQCDDQDDTFEVRYTNQGEPFREGIQIGIANNDFSKDVMVMLENREAKQLRDLLNKHFPS